MKPVQYLQDRRVIDEMRNSGTAYDCGSCLITYTEGSKASEYVEG